MRSARRETPPQLVKNPVYCFLVGLGTYLVLMLAGYCYMTFELPLPRFLLESPMGARLLLLPFVALGSLAMALALCTIVFFLFMWFGELVLMIHGVKKDDGDGGDIGGYR